MGGSSGGSDDVTGLAAKVKDIEGKARPKSILKTSKLVNKGLEEQVNSVCPDGLASGKSNGGSSNDMKGDGTSMHGGNESNMQGSFSYAAAVNKSSQNKPVAFRSLQNDIEVAGSDVVLPLSSIKEVSSKFDNTLYGYFIGKRLAFPIVDQFARNAWKKFGFTRLMMNGKGFFFFQFDSKVGLDRFLEEGPWMIRNIPIILNVWTPSVSLSKEGNKVVPVWVKFHDVPLVAFTEDGLSLIATKVGTPKRLDGFTSDMCRDLWGRSSFARALVEVSSEKDLLEEIVVAIPTMDGERYVKEKIRIEYDWKPPRCSACCVFGHTDDNCVKNVAANLKPAQKKQAEVDEEGFKQTKRKAKKRQNKGSNFGGVNVNPKVTVKPGSIPVEMPVYRRKATEWKKKQTNAKIPTDYGKGGNGNGSGTHHAKQHSVPSVSNKYDALNLDGSGYDENGTDVEEDEQGFNIPGNCDGGYSMGASTPGLDGFNG